MRNQTNDVRRKVHESEVVCSSLFDCFYTAACSRCMKSEYMQLNIQGISIAAPTVPGPEDVV